MSEEWRQAVGFEGLYEVSNVGRVRRVGRAARNGKGRGGGVVLGRILTLRASSWNNAYLVAQLWQDGKPAPQLVHRMVAAAFIGPCPEGQEVNHIDGSKLHNAPENLEYVTRGDNMKHAYRLGLRIRTVEQMRLARRKPRVVIPCSCGCGTEIETPDRKGRSRRYISGHNRRTRRYQINGPRTSQV